MKRLFLITVAVYLIPIGVSAARSVTSAPASFSAAQSLVATSSSPGNAYAFGATIVLTAPVAGDLLAGGGSIITAAPIMGDTLLIGGSIISRARVEGDFRAVGGSITTTEPVAGDLIAVGFSVHDGGRAKGSVFIIAANTELSHGASGPVTIYGNNISLAGDFAEDVTIVAGGRVTLAPDTIIRGTLTYEAPDTAIIPDTAAVMGGISYTNASYLPDVGTSRVLAFISVGFFLIARIIGALMLAGLLAGLFPKFAEAIIDRVSMSRPRDILLTILLGFAIVVATPIVVALLMLTLVGIGLALLVFVLYALLLLLALMYAGILTGGVLMRHFLGRDHVFWHDGVLGMAILSLITLVPFIGLPLVLLLTLFSVGTLLRIFFHFAFPHDEQTDDLA